ncbi:hypothetical protein GCM10023346_31780 [Arthrobacter gyeryongensis]|uniref:Uncharacterized protein n=1 Tax=Arthrobacter gyeryongensis TaxID=1650592 RepID=A0ABP9SJ79_9MICC
MNLQKSQWGSGSFYLNLGWDPAVSVGEFRPENLCLLSLRTEEADVIASIDFVRPDGLVARVLPGTILLDAEMSGRMPVESFIKELTEVAIVLAENRADRAYKGGLVASGARRERGDLGVGLVNGLRVGPAFLVL